MDEPLKNAIVLFKDLGFPVAVALFVLLRIEPRIRELTAAISELRGVLVGLSLKP